MVVSLLRDIFHRLQAILFPCRKPIQIYMKNACVYRGDYNRDVLLKFVRMALEYPIIGFIRIILWH